MVNETSDRPRLTPKGARTRARIVEEAAALIHERGVAGTTLEDVKVAAEVSGSQMYHYFPDKNELVQAVIDYQADAIVNRQRRALSSANGVEAWRNMVITAAKRTKAKGGCPLGSLVGQLAESDPEARALIAAGFDQWAAAIGDGLRSLHADGKLPSGIDPDDLAITLLATLQGGLLLAQVHRRSPSIRNCDQYPPRPCHRQMMAEQLGKAVQARAVDHEHLVDAGVADRHELGVGLPLPFRRGGDLLGAAVLAGAGDQALRRDVAAPGAILRGLQVGHARVGHGPLGLADCHHLVQPGTLGGLAVAGARRHQ